MTQKKPWNLKTEKKGKNNKETQWEAKEKKIENRTQN